MDVLAELLPPSYLVKSENTAKDKKHKQRRYQNANDDRYQEHTSESENIELTTASDWNEVDRRSGKDRREQSKNRGRWLESRAQKDRRQQSKAIQIKI